MSVSPGIWPSFSSSLLFRETGTGAAPGPFASQRESACWISSVIHRRWLQQRICIEYCYASRTGTVPLWSRHRTEAGVFLSSVLFQLEAVCRPIWASAYQTVCCTSAGFRAAILQLEHERDELMDMWGKCTSLSRVVPASCALVVSPTKLVNLFWGKFLIATTVRLIAAAEFWFEIVLLMNNFHSE